MVSLNTLLAVGGIAAAIIMFKSLGGAAGIGSSIGGGFSAFSNSLTGAIKINPVSLFGNNQTTWVNPNPTTPQQRQDSLNKQNDPNLNHSTWEEVITEVKDHSTGESWSPFIFNEGAYGDSSPNFGITPSQRFAGQGQTSIGYQAPDYTKAGAGFTATNFFGHGTTIPFSGVATSSQKATLASLTGGLLG